MDNPNPEYKHSFDMYLHQISHRSIKYRTNFPTRESKICKKIAEKKEQRKRSDNPPNYITGTKITDFKIICNCLPANEGSIKSRA